MLTKKLIRFIANVKETIVEDDFKKLFGDEQGSSMYNDLYDSHDGDVIEYLSIIRKEFRKPLTEYINQNFPRPEIDLAYDGESD
jgi:hypothetical protein